MNATREQTNPIKDSLRMTERELQPMLAALAIKDRLGPAHAASAGTATPTDGRCTSLPRVLIHMCKPDATGCTTYLVKPRDLHREGIAFLHGGFVHNDAKCAVLLRERDGKPTQIPARVISCRHVSGRVHELVAIFDKPIELDHYLFADGTPIDGE